MKYSEAEKKQLSSYVSNLERNVYTIFNLPEEVIAVIFAYVSRSPLGFRENLLHLLTRDEWVHEGGNQRLFSETAKRFHERWVVGYGHSSVAEHAVAHIGVEKISRLASAELELATSFNSFTEYSQRYQRPRRGGYVVPPELEDEPALLGAFHELQEQAFALYENCCQQLLSFLLREESPAQGETEKAFLSRVEKLAFEDARYALTLATHTNLGLTANGRSLRDTLVVLLSSSFAECRRLAKELEQEGSLIIPTLLRHVKPSPYLQQTPRHLQEQLSALLPDTAAVGVDGAHEPEATLHSFCTYESALDQLMLSLLTAHAGTSQASAEQILKEWTRGQKEEVIERALRDLTAFENPLPVFEQLHYRLDLTLSEANWHQLLRHNRKTHFYAAGPSFASGYTVPPRLLQAGLAEPFERFMALAKETGEKIGACAPAAAAYCVTNAHRRRISASASLWELYHLINLRTTPEAQWDIRQVFEQIHQQLLCSHPVLGRYAKRRNRTD